MAAAPGLSHSRGSGSAGVDSAVGRLQTPHRRGRATLGRVERSRGCGEEGPRGNGGEGRGEGERDAASAPLHARSGAGGTDPAGGQVTRGAGDRGGGGWDTAAGGRGEDYRELGKEDPLRSPRQKAEANPTGRRRHSWMLPSATARPP